MVWNILPAIRRELSINLIENKNYSQKQVANKLKITEATVSRYVAGKRGLFEINDKDILKEIKISSNRIAKGDDKTVVNEICRICKILKTSNFD